MATRIEQLLDAIETNLGADADIDAAKVYRNRVADLNDTELPGYNIRLGPDSPISELGPSNVAFIDWDQVIFIDCYERAHVENVDRIFLEMRRNVHRALMADVTQGLGFVTTSVPGGAEEPMIDDSGERKNMVYRTNWIFRLRTSIADLET